MTGFGGAEEQGPNLRLRIDIRTVNHRYLKLQSRVADELAPLAGPAEERIRKAVKRGSVTFTARVDTVKGTTALCVDEAALRFYVELCRQFNKKYNLTGDVSLRDILVLPGVVRSPEESIGGDLRPLERLFLQTLERALASLSAMREKEGTALQKEMVKRLRAVERGLGPVEKQMPRTLRELQKKLRGRVQDLLRARGVTLESGDLAREVAILVERTDVTEEVDRLRSHTAQAIDLLTRGGEVGRRLDFLTQEMLREVTTMGAKAASCAVANRVLTLKAEIDRLKEQAQNIE